MIGEAVGCTNPPWWHEPYDHVVPDGADLCEAQRADAVQEQPLNVPHEFCLKGLPLWAAENVVHDIP